MSPDPRSGGVTVLRNTFGLADAINFALTVVAESGIFWLRTASHHNAATPATCGHAMLVPLIVVSPPPTFAEVMSTPGADTTGKMFENDAMSYLRPVLEAAPTETTPSAAAGRDAAIV